MESAAIAWRNRYILWIVNSKYAPGDWLEVTYSSLIITALCVSGDFCHGKQIAEEWAQDEKIKVHEHVLWDTHTSSTSMKHKNKQS